MPIDLRSSSNSTTTTSTSTRSSRESRASSFNTTTSVQETSSSSVESLRTRSEDDQQFRQVQMISEEVQLQVLSQEQILVETSRANNVPPTIDIYGDKVEPLDPKTFNNFSQSDFQECKENM